MQAGVVVERQAPHDCKQLVCDGRGQVFPRADPSDVPADDSNACTEEACENDQPVHAAVAAGVACGTERVCTGTGICGVCIPAAVRCGAGGPETCSAQGEWEAHGACAMREPACSDGKCVAIRKVAVGRRTACGVLGDGRLRCTGQPPSGPPAPINGLFANEIALGEDHTCALLPDGSVRCWGDNRCGQLGETGPDRNGAAIVPGLTGVRHIAAGGSTTCAVLADGQVRCWGRNDKGQRGDGTLTALPKGFVLTPASGSTGLLDDASKAIDLVAGADHACLLGTNRQVACWGSDAHGKLGRGPLVPLQPINPKKPPKPAKPPGGVVRGVKATTVAVGFAHACAIMTDTTIACWGDDEKGQIGDGGNATRNVPARVPNVKGAIAIAVGDAHSCALIDGGSVLCWGDNAVGQLGDGTTNTARSPVRVPSISGAVAIAAGGASTCAMLGDGQVFCWGVAGLGKNPATSRTEPVPVAW